MMGNGGGPGSGAGRHPSPIWRPIPLSFQAGDAQDAAIRAMLRRCPLAFDQHPKAHGQG